MANSYKFLQLKLKAMDLELEGTWAQRDRKGWSLGSRAQSAHVARVRVSE